MQLSKEKCRMAGWFNGIVGKILDTLNIGSVNHEIGMQILLTYKTYVNCILKVIHHIDLVILNPTSLRSVAGEICFQQ